MDGPITDLILAGYLPLRSSGLALPCYASGPQSNAWYCAVCSIDGDHSGIIAAFEPLEAGNIVRLPAECQRPVSVGHQWHDVLLWGDSIYTGTPEIIVGQLGDKAAQLTADAPLTLLDLAMASDGFDQAVLIKAAHTRLTEQWGLENADRWRAQDFVRQRLLIEARRLLVGSGVENRAAAIRGLDVEQSEDGLHVVVPHPLRDLLADENAAEAFSENVAAFALATGISLVLPDILTAENDAVPEGRRAANLKSIERGETDAVGKANVNGGVLIVTAGSRARQLTRYLETPPWRPDWESEERFDKSQNVTIDVVDERSASDRLDQYSVVIWVSDEEGFELLAQSFPVELKSRVHSGSLLCIAAPVLPPRAPPKILAHKSRLPDFPVQIILDTSVVRSPFWQGNPKRSMDRRTADLIADTAQLVADGTPLHTWFTTIGAGHGELLLSVATGLSSDDDRRSLGSEVSSVGLLKNQIRPVRRWNWREIPVGGERRKVLHGVAVVAPQTNDFQLFAGAVVRDRLRIFGPDKGRYGIEDIPGSIAEALRFPHLAAGFSSDPGSDEAGIAISAEAPSLKALRAASNSGWSIARYTDTATLVNFDPSLSSSRSALPSDIALPQLNRFARNRGLAVRGVDPRDVIRIRRELSDEWMERFSRSGLVRSVRWYRAAINRYDEPPEVSDYAAVPVADFLRAEQDGDPAAQYLRDHPAVATPSAGAFAKRTADLRASWANPERGTSRLMFEDGKLPVRFGPVDDREVAAQKFFTVDGDISVPFLFSSRLFNIWAGATLTRSPSWSSRFSITRTFETFPIPDGFQVLRHLEGGRAALRIDPRSERLARLVNRLDEASFASNREMSLWEPASMGTGEFDGLRAKIEMALMEMIGLKRDAADLDILERLVALNRSTET